MLDQARALVAERNLVNVEWQLGDVYRLLFAELARGFPRSNPKMVDRLVWLQKTSGVT